MLRGARVAAGRARHPGHEGNGGRPIQHVGVDLQEWPHDIVARPPAERSFAMSARGDARRQTRPVYRAPPGAPLAKNRYAPVATNAAARNPAVMHGQGAVHNPNRQIYPTTTAAAADGGYRASPREAVLAAELLDVRRKARNEHAYAMKRLHEIKTEALAHRQRADAATGNLTLMENELKQEKMASDALNVIAKEKTDLLAAAEGRIKSLKSLIDTLLKEKADSDGWDNEPVRGNEALAILLPDGVEAGPPRQAEMQGRCSPGLVRQIFVGQKSSECACKRELAINGLTDPRNRYDNIAILGEGGFGTVFRGKCRKTKKTYAIKRVKPGNSGACLLREMLAYVMMRSHKNIIRVECLSDLVGSEGLVLEIAVCDLFQASRGTSDQAFTLAQQLSFEADATDGLQHMHSRGMVHCDVKLENTLICRSGGPSGFVAKVTDPGLWCGLGETRMTKTGTLGWTPLENVLGEVEASPDQDTFSVGVDVLFILARPQLKTDVVNMWAHMMLMTGEELGRLNVLLAEGGCQHQLRAEVTERTMTDGSLVRILLQAENLNSALPLSERVKTCEALAKTLSRNPLDRPNMPELTTLLRHLARETAAREKMLAAVPPVFSLRPGNVPPPGLTPPLGLVPPPRLAPPSEFGLLPPAMPLAMISGGNGGADVILLGDGTRGRDSTIVHASGSPAAGLVGTDGGRGENALGGLVQEGHLLVGPHGGGEDVGAGAAVFLAGAVEPPRGSAPIGPAPHVEGEHDGAAIPSLEDIARWAPPFPGSAARALATRSANMLRSLGGMFRLDNAPPAVASVPLAGQAHRVGRVSGGGSGGSGDGEGSGGGRAQEDVEVEVVDGPDTPLTFAQVLAGGFGASVPAADAGTPRAAPHPRLVGGLDTPLTFAQVLAGGFGVSALASHIATPPAAASHPQVVDGPDTPLTSAQVLAQGFDTSTPADIVATPPAAAPLPWLVGGPNTPLTFAQVLARGFGASAHAAGAAMPPAAPVADISGFS